MLMRSRWLVAGLCFVVCGAALVRAQTSKPAKAAPAPVSIDLADPQSALASYFEAEQALDKAAVLKTVDNSVAAKKEYIDAVLSYQIAANALERQAIAKFGMEDGLRVEGHLRSLDDQLTLDLKRVRDANVEYNKEHTSAKVYLRVERDRPDNLQTDRFQFLDVYEMIKTPGGWKVDFLQTYKCLDVDQEETYQSEQAAFPRMAKACMEMVDQLKRGTYKTADDLKAVYDSKWNHVYDEPIHHTLKPGESPPAQK